jgi:hypothetical protein
MVADTLMANEKELADEQDIKRGGVTDGGAIGDDDEPKSLREQITSAVEESRDEEDIGRGDDEPKGKVQGDKDEPKGKKPILAKEDKPVDTKRAKGKLSEDTKEDKPVTPKEPVEKTAPPPGWGKEGKTVWDSLPADAQKSVLKREKEFSDGIAKYAQKARAYDEFDAVIGPRREAIQRFGVSPAQTVDRLFQWMEAISHPNKQYQQNAFKALAQSFGVDLAQPTQSESFDPVTPTVDPNTPPQWFQQFAGAVQNKFQGIEQQTANQRQAAADNILANWAKDKPHFEQVRGHMGQLITSGIVPLKETGEVDLDSAYERAIRLNDNVSAQIKQEAEAKAKQEAEEKARSSAAAAADRVARSRRAGAGLKPAAPSINPAQARRLNGTGDNKESARESIMRSLSEISDR